MKCGVSCYSLQFHRADSEYIYIMYTISYRGNIIDENSIANAESIYTGND